MVNNDLTACNQEKTLINGRPDSLHRENQKCAFARGLFGMSRKNKSNPHRPFRRASQAKTGEKEVKIGTTLDKNFHWVGSGASGEDNSANWHACVSSHVKTTSCHRTNHWPFEE
jgi:hypothetical protein